MTPMISQFSVVSTDIHVFKGTRSGLTLRWRVQSRELAVRAYQPQQHLMQGEGVLPAQENSDTELRSGNHDTTKWNECCQK